MDRSLQHIIQSSCSFKIVCVKLMAMVIKAEFMNSKERWAKQEILYNDLLPSSGLF